MDTSRACPVCGGPVEARRSTKRYCSTRCRVKAARDRGLVRTPKEGLRPAQVRILAVLAKAKGSMNRRMISDRGVPGGWLSTHLGKVDPAERAQAEAKSGIVSLLTLGYVCGRVFKDECYRKEHLFDITPPGREALARATGGE